MQIDPMTSNNCGNLIHYLLIFEILSYFPTYVLSDLKVHNPTYPPSKTDVVCDITRGAHALKHESFLDIEFGSLQTILSVNHGFETAVRTIQNLSQQGIRMVISNVLQLSESQSWDPRSNT